MKQLLILLLALMAESACSAAADKADFYVSLQGSDAWTGTLSAPDSGGTDGPFATLERARDAVRDLKKDKPSNIVVLIRGGTYRLDETVVFGLEDSGGENTTITYAAYPGETPVFSSGREIKGWKKVTAKLPGLPKAAQGQVYEANVSDHFLTLYDDEGILPRAQSEGFILGKKGTEDEFQFPEGQLRNWPNLEDVEVVVRPNQDWIVNVLPLASVDEAAGVARTTIEATYSMTKKSFWVENVLEELDEPGEWVLNTQEGKVYLWPRGKTPVLAPTLLELIRVEGKIDFDGPTDIPVRNLCFSGLTFKHGKRYQLTADDKGLQHDWDMHDKDNALVRLRGTENCAVKQCHFLHSGSGAIRVDLHGIGNTLSGNHIEHMGGGGILLCGYGPGTKDVNKKNLVFNNHIHHVGEIYWHSPGIFIWQSGENRITNNLIHHTGYTALIVSGFMIHFYQRPDDRELVRTVRWHEVGELPKRVERERVLPYMHTRDNLIEYNEIHHAMQRLGDGNGIYIRGAGANNVIRRNYVHHLVTPNPKQSGIRTDGGQMDTLIAENLIYKCTSQGLTLKLNNRCENNIVADVIAPRGYYMKVAEGPMTGATFKRNIFYSSSDDCIFISEPSGQGNDQDSRGRELAKMADVDSDYNIYCCKADRDLGEKTLKKMQRDGVDANSRAVDPLFVDPENGDFRFKPNSPALKMGIVPIDLSKVGLQN